jgi:hypothetical protein
MDDEKYVAAGEVSAYYGYDVWHCPSVGGDAKYRAEVFHKEYPYVTATEEAGGHMWLVSTTYRAWFFTLEEARVAAEAFGKQLTAERERQEVESEQA